MQFICVCVCVCGYVYIYVCRDDSIIYVLVASMIKHVPRDRLSVVTYTIQEVYLHQNGQVTLGYTYQIPFEPTLEVCIPFMCLHFLLSILKLIEWCLALSFSFSLYCCVFY
jgi:hypothetical protein